MRDEFIASPQDRKPVAKGTGRPEKGLPPEEGIR